MKKTTRLLCLILTVIITVSCFTGLSLVSANADEQKIYFEFPDESVWTHEGLKINSRSKLANVYCVVRAIYGNSSQINELDLRGRNSQCISEDNDIFSINLEKFGEIEEGAVYSVVFATAAAGQNQTVEMAFTSDCIGDTLYVTPYEGETTRKNPKNSTMLEHFAAWKNNPYCGPLAMYSSEGALLTGEIPDAQPKAQVLSNALRDYLVDSASNPNFQYQHNMECCEELGVSANDVYEQYLADNADFINAYGENVQTSEDVPCPFLSDGTKIIPSPDYVKSVLGITDSVYTVAGSSAAMFGTVYDASNDDNDMTYIADSGVYSKTYKNVGPEENVKIKVLKNHSWDEAFPKDDFIFNIKSECDVTISYNPDNDEVNVSGDGVVIDDELEVFSVIAVGNGEDTYLNGVNWDPCDTSNSLTEVTAGVWEMTMWDIYAFDNYNIKFAINSVDENGNPTSNPWKYNFGAEVEQLYPVNTDINAVWQGKNCIFSVEDDGSTVKLRLDLREFNFKTKTGAKMAIIVNGSEEEPSTEGPTEEPTTEEPTTEEPTTEAPTTEEPTTEEPTTEEPTTEEPTTEEPTMEEPTTEPQETTEPVTEAPTETTEPTEPVTIITEPSTNQRTTNATRPTNPYRPPVTVKTTEKAEPTTTQKPAEKLTTVIIGDVDSNRIIDIKDVTRIQKALAGLVELTDAQRIAADTNGNGRVEITDATLIQKYLVKLIKGFYSAVVYI